MPGRTLLPVIDTIRRKFLSGDYEFAIPHFFEEMADDDLTLAVIHAAIANGWIRRRFTRDPRGKRYEVVGPTTDGRRAAVIYRIKTTGNLLLITTYLTR